MYQSNSSFFFDFFFNDTATTEIYTYLHTLSLHYALPISTRRPGIARPGSCLRLSASAEYPCHIGTEHPVFRLRWPIVWRIGCSRRFRRWADAVHPPVYLDCEQERVPLAAVHAGPIIDSRSRPRAVPRCPADRKSTR